MSSHSSRFVSCATKKIWPPRPGKKRSGQGLEFALDAQSEKEDGVASASGKNLEAVQITIETAVVEFIAENGGGPGVRLKK